MGLMNITGSLCKAISKLLDDDVEPAILIIDETDGDPDKSGDRERTQTFQASLVSFAIQQQIDICLIKYGANGQYGERSVFDGGAGEKLDTCIPRSARCYEKGLLETNGFDNTKLTADVKSKYQAVIIAGQSVNACCAATARGAAALGKQVLTCPLLLRGGNVATEALAYIPGGAEVGYGWPEGTQIYSEL
jgi:nicotinamidase-related amidase